MLNNDVLDMGTLHHMIIVAFCVLCDCGVQQF